MKCLPCLCKEGVYGRDVELSLSYSNFMVCSFNNKEAGSNWKDVICLEKKVDDIISNGIIPCVSAWCNSCNLVTPLSHADHPTYADALEDLITRHHAVDMILSSYKNSDE